MLVLNNITRLQQQQQQQLEQQKKLSVAKAFDPNNNNGWFDGNRNDVVKNGNDVVLKGNPERCTIVWTIQKDAYSLELT